MGEEIIILPAAFGTVLWIVYIVVDSFRRRQQLRVTAEFQGKLLDRIGSAREFGEFLNSEGGSRFLDSLSTEREGVPHLRILRAVQTGLVTTMLGLGLFIYTAALDLPFDAVANVSAFATICTAIGLGLLLSSFVSFRLSKRMGLINGRRHDLTTDVTSSL